MNESTLRTGFVCIATEGKAVDGRDITREWLVDMAETYDPTYYTAVIWPEHDRWSGHGTVQALKTEEVDDQHKRFAILCPNRDLIYLQPERPVSVLFHKTLRELRRYRAHLPAAPRRHR